MRLSPIRLALKTQSLEEWFWRLVFRGSMLRLPLSGMVYCEIATRTLDTRLREMAGTKGGRDVKKPNRLSRPQNLAVPPSKFSGSDLVNSLDMNEAKPRRSLLRTK